MIYIIYLIDRVYNIDTMYSNVLEINTFTNSNEYKELIRTSYTNPVFDFNFPDLSIIKEGEIYIAYGTQSRPQEDSVLEYGALNGVNVPVLTSSNLVEWTYRGDALPFRWTWSNFTSFEGLDLNQTWAPSVIRRADGKYVMFVAAATSIAPEGHPNMGIGVAYSDSPIGPFLPVGDPLVQGNSFECIDPFPFYDPATGMNLLYYGSKGLPIMAMAMSESWLETDHRFIPVPVLWPDQNCPYEQQLIERFTMNLINGVYRPIYVAGNYPCLNGYVVKQGRGSSVFGPFERGGVLLKGNKNLISPGPSALTFDALNQMWLGYCAQKGINRFFRRAGCRRVFCLDRVTMNAAGWLEMGIGSPTITEQKNGPVTEVDLSQPSWVEFG